MYLKQKFTLAPYWRLLEENESKLSTLRRMLMEGEQSGLTDYSIKSFIAELDECKK